MGRVAPTLSGKARLWNGPIPGTHEPGFAEQPIVERPVSRAIRAQVHGPYADLPLHAFSMGECNIILGREPVGPDEVPRWHLTISCPDRHPTWDEIKTARYRICGPDTVMAMVLPPTADYVNVATQDHVMQLWEIDDEARVWE